MEKVAIVILNYLNFKDTIECVDSVEFDTYENKEIIIVDNGSYNDSWEILNKNYRQSNVHLIKSKENLGFAKGNNIGIKFAREKLKCNFVLLVNNDTIFNDSNLVTNLMEAYSENIGIIGPRIISADNKEQNPVNTKVSKQKIVEEYKMLNSFKYKIITNSVYKKIIKVKVISDIKKMILNRESIEENISENIINNSEELVLHGACMLLTRDYFKYFPYMFPDTFLYYEENILTLLTQKVGLKKLFVDTVKIYHKEDKSSEMSFNNLDKIKLKFQLHSMKLCEGLIDLEYTEVVQKYFR